MHIETIYWSIWDTEDIELILSIWDGKEIDVINLGHGSSVRVHD